MPTTKLYDRAADLVAFMRPRGADGESIRIHNRKLSAWNSAEQHGIHW